MSDDDDVMMVPKTVAPCPATSEEYVAEISRLLMAADVAGQSGDAAAQYTVTRQQHGNGRAPRRRTSRHGRATRAKAIRSTNGLRADTGQGYHHAARIHLDKHRDPVATRATGSRFYGSRLSTVSLARSPQAVPGADGIVCGPLNAARTLYAGSTASCSRKARWDVSGCSR